MDATADTGDAEATPADMVPSGRSRARVDPVDVATILAAATVVLLPLWCAAVSIRQGWIPLGDWAEVAVRSADTFTRYRPMLGMPSTLSSVTDANVHHPGPLMFWVFAIPTKLFASSGVGSMIAAALVASTSVAAMLWGSARRAGRTGLSSAAIICAALMGAIGGPMIVSPVNPFTAIFPLGAFGVCAWGILEDDRWMWIPLVVFGSYAAQTHITFLPVVAAVLIVLLVDLGLRGVRPRVALQDRSRDWRIPVVTLAVGVACWSGPIYDQLLGTGNLWALVSEGPQAQSTLGWRYALARTLDVFSLPPRLGAFVADKEAPTLSVARAIGAVVMIGVAVVGSVVALRRGDRRPVTLGVVTSGVLAGCTIASALIPRTYFALLTPINRVIYLPSGALAWGWVLSGSLVLAAPLTEAVTARIGSTRITWAAASLVFVLIAATTLPVWTDPNPSTPRSKLHLQTARTFADLIESRTAPDAPIWVAAGGFNEQSISWGVIALLTLRGHDVRVNNRSLDAFGRQRRCIGDETARYYIARGLDGVPPDAEQVAGTNVDRSVTGPPIRLFQLSQPCTALKRY